MELHLALKNIIKTDGPNIITEGRLVNILCDFQAFDAIPASKYVMRAIIDDGYAKKLLQFSKWDIGAQQLSGQFANSTGFQVDIVWLIFQSLAYGLGWISNIDEFQQPQPSGPTKGNSHKAQIGSNPSISEVNDYFTLLVERIPETETALGVNFFSITCSNYSPYSDHFYYYTNIEVHGKIKERYLTIKVVSYGPNSSIINVEEKSIPKGDLKGFAVYSICSQIKGYQPSSLDRIVVYAE